MSENQENTGEDQQAPAQEVDWKQKARDWEARSKQNYADLQSAHSELSQAKEQLTTLEQTTTALTEQVQGFEAEKAHAELARRVADATGVPADVLRGSSEDELVSHANSLKELMKPSAPVINGQAKTPGDPPVDPKIEAVRSLFGQ